MCCWGLGGSGGMGRLISGCNLILWWARFHPPPRTNPPKRDNPFTHAPSTPKYRNWNDHIHNSCFISKSINSVASPTIELVNIQQTKVPAHKFWQMKILINFKIPDRKNIKILLNTSYCSMGRPLLRGNYWPFINNKQYKIVLASKHGVPATQAPSTKSNAIDWTT